MATTPSGTMATTPSERWQQHRQERRQQHRQEQRQQHRQEQRQQHVRNTVIQLRAFAAHWRSTSPPVCGEPDTLQSPRIPAATPATTRPRILCPRRRVRNGSDLQRDCLLAAVDQYVSALVAHNPAQAPFAANANSPRTPLCWRSVMASGIPPARRHPLIINSRRSGNRQCGVSPDHGGKRQSDLVVGPPACRKPEIDELETVVIRQGLGGSGFGAYDLAEVDPEWTAMSRLKQQHA